MTLPNDLSALQSKMSEAVRAHWKAFLFEGIVLVILGLAAILVPPIAGIAITVMLGWMFLISGAAGLAMTFWARQSPGFWWSAPTSWPMASPASCTRCSTARICPIAGAGWRSPA